MTYCSPLAAPLQKYIEEGKTLDEIGMKICGDSVKNPRRKAIRLIRLLLSKKVLDDNYISLNYDLDKANLSRKRHQAPQRKCVREQDCASSGTPEHDFVEGNEDNANHRETSCCQADDSELSRVVNDIRELILHHGKNLVIEALILLKISVAATKETSAESAEQNATRSCLAKTSSVAFSEKGHEKPS